MTKEQVSELVALMRGYVDAKVTYAVDNPQDYSGSALIQAEIELFKFVDRITEVKK